MFKVKSIECCLETLVYEPAFVIEKPDVTILTSIARQLRKGTALTDRQYELVKTKLLEYRKQFEKQDIDIDNYINELRLPLRQIDRSHWLRKLNDVLQIRFPFSKKIIDRIEEIRRIDPKVHTYKEHTHTFPYTENYLYQLVTIAKRFGEKFEIENELLETYDMLTLMQENREEYVPGVYNYQVKNLPEKGLQYLEKDCGDIRENISLYYDRRFLYGLHIFDEQEIEKDLRNYTTLTSKIIQRELPNIFIAEKKYNLNNVVDTILELKRYPIIVILGNSSIHMLEEFYEASKGVIPAEDHSVLFRLDNMDQASKDFNKYIQAKKLNNSVAKNTKIVYIKDNKVPKPLVVSDFKPAMCITFANLGPSAKSKSYVENLDLLLHYYDEMGMIDRYANRNFEIV